MKKLLATLSVAALAGMASLAPAMAQPLKVGISAEPYPPFTVPDAAGNWTGWEVDFAKTVCEEAKLDCVITPLAWDGIIPALNAGKIDMIITSMSITNDRLKTIDFTDSYYKSKSAVIGAKDMQFDATPEGLKDKVIGVQVGTRHLFYAQKHFAP
ncbi:transporter substrate-binding domain-containing protein, partial [Paracoccus sp. (in: a-proteobacteria)]|uniref:transporter substrate-binding domain-containing protein n=1 Tax=Paracoccus sp. TaxID=267 RepID=UPI00289A8F5F